METDEPGRPLVLIADPSVETRLLLAWVFRRHGFRTADAKNGAETFDAAIELLPDLLVMEILLPDMDGFTLAAMLRDADVEQCIPVIALTTYSHPDLEKRAGANGIREVVRKPCLPRHLVNAARSVLDSSGFR